MEQEKRPTSGGQSSSSIETGSFSADSVVKIAHVIGQSELSGCGQVGLREETYVRFKLGYKLQELRMLFTNTIIVPGNY